MFLKKFHQTLIKTDKHINAKVMAKTTKAPPKLRMGSNCSNPKSKIFALSTVSWRVPFDIISSKMSCSTSKSKICSVVHSGSMTSAPRNSTKALWYSCLFGGGYWWNMLLKQMMLRVSIIPRKIPIDNEISRFMVSWVIANTLAEVLIGPLMSLKVSSSRLFFIYFGRGNTSLVDSLASLIVSFSSVNSVMLINWINSQSLLSSADIKSGLSNSTTRSSLSLKK